MCHLLAMKTTAPEPPIFRVVSTDSFVWGRLPRGGFLIRNMSGSVTIPHEDIPAVRAVLIELDATPRLSTREFTPIGVTGAVELVLCSDGNVVIAVGSGDGPRATVEIETWELTRLVRALS